MSQGEEEMNKHLSKIAAAFVAVMVVVVVAVVAVSLPGPQAPTGRIGPVVEDPCPNGLKPVARGALTCVPEIPVGAPVAQPEAPAAPAASCPAGQKPVAPGSFTCVHDVAANRPEAPATTPATCPPGQRPVAPGAATCIPQDS
jgi:hypothetical protein